MLPDRPAWEGRIARALEIARRRAGMTQAEAVEALSPYQSRSSSRPTSRRQRWYDWVARPVSVSSLALVAAAHLANMTVDELLNDAGLPQTPRDADESGELRRQLAEVQAELARQRVLNTEVQRHLAELADRVGGRPSEMSNQAMPTAQGLGDALRVLAVLEDRVAELGSKFGRRWDSVLPDHDSESLSTAVRRRVGAVQARTTEIAGMAGVPYGGYPTAPISEKEEVLSTWVVRVVEVLQEQLAAIETRTDRLKPAADGPTRRVQNG